MRCCCRICRVAAAAMPLHTNHSSLRRHCCHLQFWIAIRGQSLLHPGARRSTNQFPSCLWMWADSDRRLSERRTCSGRRSGSGNGRDFRAKHTDERTGAAGFFLRLHQRQWNRQDCVRRQGTHHSANHSIREQFKPGESGGDRNAGGRKSKYFSRTERELRHSDLLHLLTVRRLHSVCQHL
jgi:hypothetical protein